MKLSVVIVNYNVKYFLDQCLYSVLEASKDIDTEVIVVDNKSVDGSVAMVRKKYPQIKLIANTENVGFSKANNQAISIAAGEYVLILNPDTVVQEDTFQKCIEFLDKNPKAGSCGVKMIEGNGKFLPESKRSLPTPWVAFYKTFGLSALFPKSKKFGRYHLTYLPNDKVNEVDVLPGAYMMVRKSVLDKVGYFDEAFFMYGEDIDLSYRIQLAGYANYYFPETAIIHYKGESTKKTSVNYVYIFYNAMLIFAKKHFSSRHVKWFTLLINFAICFRAFLAIIRRFVSNYLPPVIDVATFCAGFFAIAHAWSIHIFGNPGMYSKMLYVLVIPIYVFIWVVSIFFAGGYDKPVKYSKVLKGILWGAVVILVAYALLPLHLRFSRAIILIGTAWAVVISFITKYILGKMFKAAYKFELRKQKKRFAFIGNVLETPNAVKIIKQSGVDPELIINVSVNENETHEQYIGSLKQIKEIIEINKIEELIFSAKDMSSKDIIKTMLKLEDFDLEYKIASPNGISIIGSSSIDTAGDLYSIDFNSLAHPVNKRKKRLLDAIMGLGLMVFGPLFVFTFRKKWFRFIGNLFLVFLGRYSFVGYFRDKSTDYSSLPVIKKGILTPLDLIEESKIEHNKDERVNILYARDYTLVNDIQIILKAFKKLSRKIS